MSGLLLRQLYVGPVCHRYSAINVLFGVVLCSGFAGMHLTFLFFLPHQDLHAKIAIGWKDIIRKFWITERLCPLSSVFVMTLDLKLSRLLKDFYAGKILYTSIQMSSYFFLISTLQTNINGFISKRFSLVCLLFAQCAC